MVETAGGNSAEARVVLCAALLAAVAFLACTSALLMSEMYRREYHHLRQSGAPVVRQLRALKKAIAWNPLEAELHHETGRLYHTVIQDPGLVNSVAEFLPANHRTLQGAFESACAATERAAILNPVRSGHHYLLGWTVSQRTRFGLPPAKERQEAEFERAAALDPNNVLLLIEVADYYLRTGQKERAIPKLRQVVAPTVESTEGFLNKLWKHTKSVDDLRQMLPEGLVYRTGLARFLARHGMPQAAREECVAVCRAALSEPLTRKLQLAEVLCGVRAYDDARAFLRQWLQHEESRGDKGAKPVEARTLLGLALIRSHEEAGDLDGALATATELAESSAASDSLRIKKAELLEKAGRLAEAAGLYRETLRARFGFAPVLLRAKGDPVAQLEAARLDECRQSVALNPNSAQNQFRLALAYARCGLLKQAIEHLRQAQALDSQAVIYRHALGSLYQDSQMFVEAAAEYRAALKLAKIRSDRP